MMEQDKHALSPEGRQRREAMLDELLDHVDRRRTTRITRRRVAWIVSVLVVGVLCVRMAWWPDGGANGSRDRIVDATGGDAAQGVNGSDGGGLEAVEPGSLAQVVTRRQPRDVIFVESDPAVLERYRTQEAPGLVRRVDDLGLIESLAAINRPAGLIRIGDKVRPSRPVSDAELALNVARP